MQDSRWVLAERQAVPNDGTAPCSHRLFHRYPPVVCKVVLLILLCVSAHFFCPPERDGDVRLCPHSPAVALHVFANIP